MKFGINAQVIIALLGALYILMVCREKYRIEYAEGEPVAEDEPETIVIGGQEEPVAEDERELADKEAAAVKKVEKNGKKLTMKERALADKAVWEEFPHKGYPKRARPAVVMPKPGSADFILSKARQADQPRPAVMPKPGSPEYILSEARRASPSLRTSELTEFDKTELNIGVIPAPSMVAVKAKKTSVAKAPIVAVRAEKSSIIEEEEQAMIEGQAAIEEEAMIEGQATIEEEAMIEGQATIEEEAMIEEEATIEGQAMIEKEDIKYLVSDEEVTIEGQAMIEEEGMSTGAIVGITAVSIVTLIAIMIAMRRLRR